MGAEKAQPAAIEGPAQAGPVVFISDRMLGARLYLHTWIRLLGAGMLAAGALIAPYVVGIERINVPGLLVLALIIAAYNTPVWLYARAHRGPLLDESACAPIRRLMIGTILLDYLALGVVVWMLGGPRSPFISFFLLHVVIGCILLPRAGAIACAGVAYAFVAGLVVNEWLGLVPSEAPVGAVEGVGPLDARYAMTILVVHAGLFGMVVYLMGGLGQLLRRGERELHDAVDELNRLSDVRRDFLNIAVHDVRAPASGVVMILNNFIDGLNGPLSDSQRDWLLRARRRLDGLSELLKDLQILATLEATDIAGQFVELDVAKLLTSVVEEHADSAAQHGHTLSVELPPSLPAVRGIERLLREAVANYITNAIKYTPEGGRIVVRGLTASGALRIEVQDTGIGIDAEDQRRLFREFVRVKIAGTAVSKATGTGLGLSIVRHVAEQHGGRVGVRSSPGAGSTFSIDIPIETPAPEPVGAGTERIRLNGASRINASAVAGAQP